MIALAVDPGGTVGWAMLELDPDADSIDLTRIVAGQTAHRPFLDWCRDSIARDWVVFLERFFITARTATLSTEGTHATLDSIGTIKSLCRWAGAELHLQTANDAKNFVTNGQLKTLGLWVPGADHARDAERHLLYGLVRHGRGRACEDLKRRMA